jgi:hypothetical protein
VLRHASVLDGGLFNIGIDILEYIQREPGAKDIQLMDICSLFARVEPGVRGDVKILRLAERDREFLGYGSIISAIYTQISTGRVDVTKNSV